MRIETDFASNYPDDPVRHFHFKSDGTGPLFKYGLQKPTKPVDIYLCLEEPIVSSPSISEWGPYCKKILTLCPFTAEWIQDYLKIQSECVFFPTNPRYIPTNFEKKYDLIYCGHMSYETTNLLEIASKMCKLCVVSMSHTHLVTHCGVSYQEKMNLIAQSKISLVHNINLIIDRYRENIRQASNFHTNKAYAFADSHSVLPQMKSRTFEAAFCKSLMFCRNDPWNLINRYFSTNEMESYDVDGFKTALEQVLNQDHTDKTEAAYETAMSQYTTDHFQQRFLS